MSGINYEPEQPQIFVSSRIAGGQAVVELKITKSVGGLATEFCQREIDDAINYLKTALGFVYWSKAEIPVNSVCPKCGHEYKIAIAEAE